MGVVLRVAAVAALLAGLAAPAEKEKFAGTWEATSKGTVYLVLKVKTGEKISGTLNAGKITMNDDGDLVEAGPVEDHEAPIFFAQVEGDKLTFGFQDEDNTVMEFELKLTGDGAGELRIVDKDHPKLKAFTVKKVAQG